MKFNCTDKWCIEVKSSNYKTDNKLTTIRLLLSNAFGSHCVIANHYRVFAGMFSKLSEFLSLERYCVLKFSCADEWCNEVTSPQILAMSSSFKTDNKLAIIRLLLSNGDGSHRVIANHYQVFAGMFSKFGIFLSLARFYVFADALFTFN